ncbi:MAG: hypoxanthine phosphoribosyltransferase [Coriobacteriia bacterium]|nr:hypoxanthine phosphoribosyltransferase [Coriobacteriia bacterium]MBN2840134.1 hypoxanthine phosphoribosyltransferase [Coriobacteriia bacterium]
MSVTHPDPRIDRVLHTSEDIQAAVRRIGSEITRDYEGRDLALITVLKGGTMFLADLCRAIELPLTVDFMAISSYGPGAEGSVRITKDLDDSIEGRDVLVVEDIIDTGLTLSYLLRVLRQRKPASVSVCTLLDKDARRLADLPIEYRGFSVPDRFLVGYGLDLDGLWRTLPYVATLHDEIWDRP